MSKHANHGFTIAAIVFLVNISMLSMLTYSIVLEDQVTTSTKPSPHQLQYRSFKAMAVVDGGQKALLVPTKGQPAHPVTTEGQQAIPIPTRGQPTHPVPTNEQPTKHFLTAVLLVRIYQSDNARLTLAHTLQWLKYMRYAGVTKFYLYDAYESPEESLQYDLQHYPYIAYHPWNHLVPYQFPATQLSAYQHAIDHYKHEC